jgi:hypothetical protein
MDGMDIGVRKSRTIREGKKMDKVITLKKEAEKKGGVRSRIYQKKAEMERRSVVLKVYTTHEEKKQLEANAKRVGRDVSTFFRELGLDKRMITSKDSQRWGILGKLGSQFIQFRNDVRKGSGDHHRMIELLSEILNEIKLLRKDILK